MWLVEKIGRFNDENKQLQPYNTMYNIENLPTPKKWPWLYSTSSVNFSFDYIQNKLEQ